MFGSCSLKELRLCCGAARARRRRQSTVIWQFHCTACRCVIQSKWDGGTSAEKRGQRWADAGGRHHCSLLGVSPGAHKMPEHAGWSSENNWLGFWLITAVNWVMSSANCSNHENSDEWRQSRLRPILYYQWHSLAFVCFNFDVCPTSPRIYANFPINLYNMINGDQHNCSSRFSWKRSACCQRQILVSIWRLSSSGSWIAGGEWNRCNAIGNSAVSLWWILPVKKVISFPVSLANCYCISSRVLAENLLVFFDSLLHQEPVAVRYQLSMCGALTGKLSMLNRCAADGASPLFLASQEGHTECVQLLLDNGADANLSTQTPVALPLHAALQFNRTELVYIEVVVYNLHWIQRISVFTRSRSFCAVQLKNYCFLFAAV